MKNNIGSNSRRWCFVFMNNFIVLSCMFRPGPRTPSMLAKYVYQHAGPPDLASPYSSSSNVCINISSRGRPSAFPQPYPPFRGVHRSLTFMQSRPHICEEIVHMSNHHAQYLILGDRPVHTQAEPHQYPREIWSGEDEQSEEAESGVGIPARPNVH
jgi:hypothetical protein